jgi:hypothetical protein
VSNREHYARYGPPIVPEPFFTRQQLAAMNVRFAWAMLAARRAGLEKFLECGFPALVKRPRSGNPALTQPRGES